jgi:hypothetical protein
MRLLAKEYKRLLTMGKHVENNLHAFIPETGRRNIFKKRDRKIWKLNSVKYICTVNLIIWA